MQPRTRRPSAPTVAASRNRPWWRVLLPALGLLSGLLCGAAQAATFVVDRTDDANVSACTVAANDCTLRGAITAANGAAGADTISFDASVTPLIAVGTALPSLSSDISIAGPGASTLTVDAGGVNFIEIFQVNSGVSATLSGLTISHGTTGIRNNGGTVSAANCTVSDNTNGTGIVNLGGGTVNATNCTISGNTDGILNFDGLFNNGSTVNATNCTLSGNSDHGILNATLSMVTATNCTLSGNVNYGIFNQGTATAINCTLSGSGYAISNPGTLTATNCTFSGNSNGIGNAGTVSATNCTISGNTIYGITTINAGTVTIKNTICAGNTTNVGGAVPTQLGNNLTGGNPLLGALANNGGPTFTMLPLTNSPAIDQGLNSAPLATDQRGRVRPFNDPAITDFSGGDGSDIGAVEVGEQNGNSFVVNLTADTDDGACTYGDCTLREAINLANAQTGADTITFAGSVTPTITLNGTPLPTLSDNVTITGPGAALLAVSANNLSRVFVIGGITANISGLTMAGGNAFLNRGGGIANSGTLTLSNCTLSGNQAQDGGGISNAGLATLNLSHCTVSGNQAQNGGGGIFNDSFGTVTVNNSTLSQNSAQFGAGAIYSDTGATVTVQNSTLSQNSVTSGNGGGILNGGTMTVQNSTLSQNSASGGGFGGGGIYNDGTLTVQNCTLHANSTGDQGGGLYSHSSGTLTLQNSIVAGNSAGTGGADIFGTLAAGDYNLVQSTSGVTLAGTHNITGQDPQLDPAGLASNGGPTQTIALLGASPALDQGQASGGVSTDQRGQTRPHDLTGLANATGGDGSDIGAFEAQTNEAQPAGSLVVTVPADTDDGACTYGDCTLREAINRANAQTGTDTISFAPSVTPSIALGSALPNLSDNVTISGPGANSLAVDVGGANVYTFAVNSGVSASVSGLTLSNTNTAIVNFGGTVSATNCTLSGYSFAGIWNDTGTATATNCTLSNNPGGATTFGIYNPNGGMVSVTNCTLSSSPGSGSSFGIVNNGGTVSATNCTLSGFDSAIQSGLQNSGDTLSATNCTVSGNTTGINNGGTVTIKNTICAGNTPNNLVGAGTLIQQGNNLLSGDPKLGPLASNGGPTFTMRLLSGSPALDAGKNSAPLVTDQRGLLRPVDLVGVANASGGDGSDIGAYEVQPQLSINDVTVTEGNGSTVNAIFTVSLSATKLQTVTVNYATANGTATAGSDYGTASDSDGGTPGTLTLPAGTLSGTVTVPIMGNLLNETNETFKVNLSGAVNAAISDGLGVGTINDNDATPHFLITDATVTEGDSGPGNASFSLTLSAVSGRTVTATYRTADGTATAGSDYVAHPQTTLTFLPGETGKTITVAVNGDTSDEANETYKVLLLSATNAAITDHIGAGTITDDDPLPSLSISDVPATIEGNAGTTHNALFTVTLTGATNRTVTVNYVAADGTAGAGSDYTAASGTLTFLPGQTSKTLPVQVLGDSAIEPDETFKVNLGGATFATLADAQGVTAILDDDPTPLASVDDVSVTEGDGSPVNAVFHVVLSAPSKFTATVTYITADGTATAGVDYVAHPQSTLTFLPGETSKTVTVMVNGDTFDEGNETFKVVLQAATIATLGDDKGVGTITDNDPLPVVAISDAPALSEGAPGTSHNALFTVTLTGATRRNVTVNYSTNDNTAMSGSDYSAASGTITFTPGQTVKTLPVAVLGDALSEATETFKVNLGVTGSSYATLGDSQGVGSITDDDPLPTLSIGDVTKAEGDSLTTSFTFTVTLSQASGQTVTVAFATADGTAVKPGDYAAASGTLTLAPGTLAKTIIVAVKGDTTIEPDETFSVNLSSPSGATLADAQGQGNITNDDASE